MKLYGIKNCGSVKKARDFLESKHIEYEFIDFKTYRPSIKELESWVKQAGLEVILNKKGTTYKKLNLKDKNLTNEQLLNTISENPTLIKRPVITKDGKIVIVGFGQEKYEKLF